LTTEQRYEPDVLKQYEGPGITVHWEPKLCIHVSNCIRALPGVFKPDARPWVNVEAASADEIAAAIESCPTGALSYLRTDGGPQEAPESPTKVEPRPNGPLFVRGDIVKIHQNASVHVASLEPGADVTHQIGEDRGVYAYLIEGAATFADQDVATGDAAKVTEQRELRIRAREQSELILVDVPMQFEPVGIWRGRI